MSTGEPVGPAPSEHGSATWAFGGQWATPAVARTSDRPKGTTFRVEISGVRTREHHDAIHASINSALLRHLAALDVAGSGARLMANCTCAGTGGSGSSVARAAPEAVAPPSPLEFVPTAMPDDRFGRIKFHLSGTSLSAEEIETIEGNIQQAVLPHLASIQYGPGEVGVLVPHTHRLGGSAGMVFGPVDRATPSMHYLLEE